MSLIPLDDIDRTADRSAATRRPGQLRRSRRAGRASPRRPPACECNGCSTPAWSQVVGVTDPLALGYPVMAALGVRVERNVRDVADRIADIDGVIYVVFTSGSFDLLVEVLCEDSARLLAVIDDEVRAIDDVRSVESFTYFGIHTHRFVWGAR